MSRPPPGCASSSSSHAPRATGDDLTRDLGDYDRAFGLDRDGGGRLMAAAKNTTRRRIKQITYLAAALKAPRITEAAARLADQARDAGWTHEDYLAAVLEREVSARNASGAAAAHPRRRVPGAARPSRTSTSTPNPPSATPSRRLASGGFLTEARNVVLLGPPGTGKTHLATALGVAAARHGHRVLFATATDWVTRLTDAHRAGRLPQELTSCAATG